MITNFFFFDENPVDLSGESGLISGTASDNTLPSSVAEDLAEIRRMMEEDRAVAEEESSTEEEESSTEEEESSTADPLAITFDRPVDSNLYLSGKASGYVTINDMYSLTLSLRNLVLVIFLCFILFKAGSLLKNVIYKIFNK